MSSSLPDLASHSAELSCVLPIDRDEIREQIRAAVARRRSRSVTKASSASLPCGTGGSLLLHQYLANRPTNNNRRGLLTNWLRRPVDWLLRQMSRLVNFCTLPLQMTILDHLWLLSQTVQQLSRSVEESRAPQATPESFDTRRKSA
jgi:hypothetical protein